MVGTLRMIRLDLWNDLVRKQRIDIFSFSIAAQQKEVTLCQRNGCPHEAFIASARIERFS